MSKERDAEMKVGSGALVGLGVVSIVQMLSLNGLDRSLKVSVFGFAISIPLLTAMFISAFVGNDYEHTTDKPLLLKAVSLVGYMAAFIGISAMFFHFSIYATIIFLACSVIGFVAVTLYDNKLRDLKGPKKLPH